MGVVSWKVDVRVLVCPYFCVALMLIVVCCVVVLVYQLDLFTDPMVNRALSGFFGQLRSDDRSRKEFLELFLQPRRDSTRAILDRAVVRGEIHDDYDIDLICDTLTGPFIFRVIIPEIGPLDDRLVDGTVRMVLNDLNYMSSL